MLRKFTSKFPLRPHLLRSGLLLAAAAPLLFGAPAAAQDAARLERVETQLRALQRAVFPGGDQRFFEPEITPEAPVVNTPTTGVGTTALTDVLARLDALESQLARLTAATEVNQNALTTLEARLASVERGAVVAGASGALPPASGVILTPSVRPVNTPTPGPSSTPAPAPAPALAPISTPAPAAASGPTAERLAGVSAITKPQTADAGDDEYTYGFRLWDAGFYPEAQQQLALFLERYPRHSRVSFARNLLGRAFLDAGDARTAATHFFENYQSNKQADRSADSLLFLAESMTRLDDTRRACIALAEFGETYPALAAGRLKGQYDTLKGRVTCT
jgi:TolA-binding protein